MEVSSLELNDGRQMVYAQYGPHDGYPLLFMHGTPGSHLIPHNNIEYAQAHSLRVIAMSRPGYSQSSPWPAYSLLDYVDDIRHLLDTLELKRCSIMGVSGGASYALACASRLAERVDIVSISGARLPLPPEDTPPREQIEAWGQGLAELAALDDTTLYDAILNDTNEQDKPFLALHRDWLLNTIREAMQQGPGGYIDDVHNTHRAWGFGLDEVGSRVLLWQGDHDNVQDAQALAVGLPHCEAIFLENTGHWASLEQDARIWRTMAEVIRQQQQPE